MPEAPAAARGEEGRLKAWRTPSLVLLVAGAACAPLVASDFQLFKLTSVLIYALALLGVNILVGYNGQISLGHGAFYALGAYAAAIPVAHFGLPHWAAVPFAGLVCLGAGFAFGLPTMRLGGMHFAMATFALAVVFPGLAKHKSVEHWTGGAQGLVLDKPPVPLGLALSFDQWLYLFTLAVLVVSLGLAADLLRGRVGRAIVAIRDDPVAAEAAGICTAWYKPATLGIGAMFILHGYPKMFGGVEMWDKLGRSVMYLGLESYFTVWGFLAAAVSGFLAIAWLIRFLQTNSFFPFVVYRWVVGTAVIVIFATGIR